MKQWYICLIFAIFLKSLYCYKCILTAYDEPRDCSKNRICRKNYTVSVIDYEPYSSSSMILKERLESCCGKCVSYHERSLRNISELTAIYLESDDFIGPLAAHKTTQYMYGFYYLPVLDVPAYVYITLPPKSYIQRVLEHLKPAYPLFLIVLLMAIISGFCSWMIETWFNTEEFPRPVFRGWFEGCWWSFVSMTTVGYGDKTPRTVIGRLYAVIWILVGITTFNIFTGICTTALQNSLYTETPTLKGARVGICQYRILDAWLAANLDSVVVKTNGTSFKNEIVLLLTYLEEKKIDGILLDQITLNHILHISYPKFLENDFDSFDSLKNIAKKSYDFLANKAVTTKKSFANNDYSYGILVKDRDVYNFIHDTFSDHYISRNTHYRQDVNKNGLQERNRLGVSDEISEYQFLIAVALTGVVALVFLLAIVVRVYQIKTLGRRIGTSTGTV